LPHKEDSRTPGQLRYDERQGIVLELFGETHHDPDNVLVSHPFGADEGITFFGIDTHSKKVSLHNCFLRDGQLSGSMARSKYSVHTAFLGTHLASLDDLCIKAIRAGFTSLDEWVWISGFGIKSDPDQKEALIEYKLPQDIAVDLYDSGKLTIGFSCTGISTSYYQKEVNLSQAVYLKYVPIKPMSYFEICRKMWMIENFFALGIGSPINESERIIESEMEKEIYGDKAVFPSIEVISCVKDWMSTSRVTSSPNMLFNLRDVEGDLQPYLNLWVRNYEGMKPVYHLYFSLANKTIIDQPNDLLNLTQALETFHRRTHDGKYLEENDYETLLAAIVCSVDKKYESWVKEKMRYSNELSLRKRLCELINEYCPDYTDYFGDTDRFISKVVDSRNWYIHYDPRSEKNAVKDVKEYVSLIAKLMVFLKICLLRQMGFGDEYVTKLIERHNPRGRH